MATTASAARQAAPARPWLHPFPLVRGLLVAALLLAAGAAQAQVPGKPTDVVLKPVARTLDALDASWTAPSGTVASYDVQYKKRADAETEWTDAATDTTATTHSLTGLGSSERYVVRVRATNSSGDGAWSDNGSASTHPPEEELHDTERYQRIPRGVKPGQSFRLLTAVGSVAATSADVETYHAVARSADNFIISRGDAAALGSQEYRISTGRYRALVSTPGVDAREHTDTTWTADDKGVPIYWRYSGPTSAGTYLAGPRIADDYEDFYDGDWDNSTGNRPWTGSDNDGTQRDDGGVMGAALVGHAGGADSPLAGGTAANDTTRNVYALSPVYRVMDREDLPLANPRVVLDTTLTIGSYNYGGGTSYGFISPHWGVADIGTLGTIVPGRLGGDQYQGDYGNPVTIIQLLSRGFDATYYHAEEEYWLDGSGTAGSGFRNFALELHAPRGPDSSYVTDGVPIPTGDLSIIEGGLGRSGGFISNAEDAIIPWKYAVGQKVPVRVLDPRVPDIWNGTLTPGTAVAGVGEGVGWTGFGGPGETGTLTRRSSCSTACATRSTGSAGGTRGSVFIDGGRLVSYDENQFSTTPDLPEGVRLVEVIEVEEGDDSAKIVAMRRRADADADYVQQVQYASRITGIPYDGPFFLTHAPGAAPAAKPYWTATVTPGKSGDFTGYRRAGIRYSVERVAVSSETIATVAPPASPMGSLSAPPLVIDGVTYTVNAVGYFLPSDGRGGYPWLDTTPPLPAGRLVALQTETLRRQDTPLMRWIDTDLGARAGYLWGQLISDEGSPDALLYHGWGEDSDGDEVLDARTLRIWVAPRIRVSATPGYLREDTPSVTVTVTATLEDGVVAERPVEVAVRVGSLGAENGATLGQDYALTRPAFTITIPAGRSSASATTQLALLNDTLAEPPERLLVTASAPRHQVANHAEIAIADDADDEDEGIVYWEATLDGERFHEGGVLYDGYYRGIGGAVLAPSSFRCCRGRQTTDSAYRVDSLGREDEEFKFWVRGILDENGVLLPEFRGAVLRVGDVVRSLESAVVEQNRLTWDALPFPNPSDGRLTVRLTGPDYPLLTGVDVVSTPTGADNTYLKNEVIEIALTFDDAVTVAGTPALKFTLGTEEREAAYARGSGTRTLVFAYTVQQDSTNQPERDEDGIDVGAVADAVTLDADESILGTADPLAPLYGDLDPAPFASHKVDGRTTAGAAQAALTVLGATADEDGGSLVFSLTLSFATGTAVTLDYATADGTATAGSDYTATSGMRTIAANTRVATVSVPILDDTADEVDEETFTLTVSNVTGATVADTSAEGVIVDDDDSVVSIAGPTAAGTGPGAHLFEGEAGGAGGSWTVSTAAAVPVDLPVNVAVVETGAGDFVPSSGEGAGRLTIAAGTRSVTFNPVVADAVDEGPSTVTVWVAPGPGYAVATGAASAAVAVRDDDLGGDAPFLFSVEPGSATVVEGASPAFEQVVRTVADGTFTETGDLARVGLSLDGLQLRWGSTTHLETAAGDFTATASTATLAVGDFAVVTTAGGTGLEARRALGGVTVAADTEAEGAERFLVALERAAGNGALLRAAAHPGVPGIATALRGQGFYRVAVTVVDAPTVTLALGEDELFEGATTTVTATMTPPRANAFDVTVGLSSARAEFVGGNTLSFAAGAAGEHGHGGRARGGERGRRRRRGRLGAGQRRRRGGRGRGGGAGGAARAGRRSPGQRRRRGALGDRADAGPVRGRRHPSRLRLCGHGLGVGRDGVDGGRARRRDVRVPGRRVHGAAADADEFGRRDRGRRAGGEEHDGRLVAAGGAGLGGEPRPRAGGRRRRGGHAAPAAGRGQARGAGEGRPMGDRDARRHGDGAAAGSRPGDLLGRDARESRVD